LPRCIVLWDKFEVEGGATASLNGDPNRKSNRRLICQTGGLASGVRHEREKEADMPAQS
jgi:hypothetical protein